VPKGISDVLPSGEEPSGNSRGDAGVPLHREESERKGGGVVAQKAAAFDLLAIFYVSGNPLKL
jgi:hypothetical protein